MSMYDAMEMVVKEHQDRMAAIDAHAAALEAQLAQFKGYLERAGWGPCNIAACGCSGWHKLRQSRGVRELEAQLAAARAEIDMLQIRHGATMLHGQTVVDEFNALQKQAAQMREALTACVRIAEDDLDYRPDDVAGGEWEEIKQALSLDAGKGYVSVEQLKPLVLKWRMEGDALLAESEPTSGQGIKDCAEDLAKVLEGHS